jgi:hypothetical protein
MPSIASQVEVQAPPGLENLPAHLHRSEEGDSDASIKAAEEMKGRLIQEVMSEVRKDIDSKTATAVEALWQKGQKAMQHMQQQHLSQTEQLRGQLAACAESYKNLERENALLRSSLEALMKHLTTLFGTPQYMSPLSVHMPKASPFFPPSVPGTPAGPGTPSNAPAFIATPMSASARLPAASTELPADQTHPAAVQSTDDSDAEEVEDLLMPAPAPATPRESNSASSASCTEAASSTPSGGTGSEPAIASALQPTTPPISSMPSAATAPVFTLTLRRADTVPVGLDVRGEESCLLVERVRAGGAVEAWNRQCPGDGREIRPGDRIININGAEDPDAMRQECLTKFLLKMTVLRGNGIVPPQQPLCFAAGQLRADADEFRPQSWLNQETESS